MITLFSFSLYPQCIMNFDISNLIAGFLFSIVGLWLFRVGRQRINTRWTIIGILLMTYSIFTPTTLLTWLVGFLLCGLAYYFRFDY